MDRGGDFRTCNFIQGYKKVKYAIGEFECVFNVYGKALFIERMNFPFIEKYDEVYAAVTGLAKHVDADQVMFTTENPAILSFLRKKGWIMETAVVKMPVGEVH